MDYRDEESKELTLWKIEREEAMANHTRHADAGRNVFNSAMEFGLEAIRTATLINGGAVIAIFAFLGATFNSDASITAVIQYALLKPAFIFAAGAVLSGTASGFSYFSQLTFSEMHAHIVLTWKHPYSMETDGAVTARKWGEFWRALAVACVLVSYGCLIFGLSAAYSSLSNAMASSNVGALVLPFTAFKPASTVISLTTTYRNASAPKNGKIEVEAQ